MDNVLLLESDNTPVLLFKKGGAKEYSFIPMIVEDDANIETKRVTLNSAIRLDSNIETVQAIQFTNSFFTVTLKNSSLYLGSFTKVGSVTVGLGLGMELDPRSILAKTDSSSENELIFLSLTPQPSSNTVFNNLCR